MFKFIVDWTDPEVQKRIVRDLWPAMVERFGDKAEINSCRETRKIWKDVQDNLDRKHAAQERKVEEGRIFQHQDGNECW